MPEHRRRAKRERKSPIEGVNERAAGMRI